MKKKIMTTALIAAIAIGAAATQVSAGWGQRGGGYYGGNMPGQGPRMMMQNNQVPGPRMQMMYNQLDPAVQEKLDKFFTDTQDLHKQITVKRAEHMALLRSDNPDPAAVGKLAGELFDLRTQVRQKAEEAGIAEYLGPMGPRGGMGPGKGGPGMRGGMMGGMHGGRYMNNMQGGFGPRGSWN